MQVDTPPVGAEPSSSAPDYDSGWTASADPQFDLTGRHAVVGAGPHYWRVQVRDGENNESEWSDWATFNYVAAPTIIIDSPTGPFGDPTPTILAHLSSGTVSQWQAMVTGPDRSDVRARTGLVVGSTIDWTLPLREERLVSTRNGGAAKAGRLVFDGPGPWWLNLRVWDTVARATGVGQAPYMETWVQLSFDDDLGVQPATGLLVAPVAEGDPRREWSWQRTEEADGWVVTVNGDVVARLDADDVTVSEGRYVWVDSGHVAPLRPQVLAVRALEGDARSVPVSVEVVPPPLPGVWLIPDDTTIEPIVLRGDGVDEWTRTEFRATYTTSTGTEVDVTYGQPGRVGSFAGTVDKRDDIWEALRRVETLRRSPNRNARLVWASHSIPVRVRDIDATASSQILPHTLEHIVRFGFVELDG